MLVDFPVNKSPAFTPYTLHLTPENNEMLRFYWSVGKDIVERQHDNKYGPHFYENLSNDLTKVVGNIRGLAPTSLRYTKYFYSLVFNITLYPLRHSYFRARVAIFVSE